MERGIVANVDSGLYGWIAILLLLCAWLTRDQPRPSYSDEPPRSSLARVDGDRYPKTIIDAYGSKAVLQQAPTRIASAVLAADELLLDLIPPHRIAAVSFLAKDDSISNVVELAKGVQRVTDANVEALIELQPDLVFLADFTSGDVVDLCRSAGMPVLRMARFDSLENIREKVRLVAAAVDAEPRMQVVIRWMDDAIGNVRRHVAKASVRPSVFYYSADGYTAGAGTLMDELIAVAGGRNAAAEAGMVGDGNMSTELAVAVDPDVILMSGYAPAGVDPRAALLSHPAWQGVKAIRTGNVHIIPSQHITCISHHVVRAAEDIARVLHPRELAGKPNAPPLPPIE